LGSFAKVALDAIQVVLFYLGLGVSNPGITGRISESVICLAAPALKNANDAG
jgi:hypothetical protein